MVFAAGLGLRMRPLTESTPKPLIEVKGKKLIDYSINTLKNGGVEDIHINTYYLPEQLNSYFEERSEINIIREEERLETGGGLKNAKETYSFKNVITINSDVIIAPNSKVSYVNSLNEEWQKLEQNEADILMLVVNKKDIYGYKGDGDFNIDEEGYLTKSQDGNSFVFTGLQAINTEILNIIDKKIFSLSEIFTKSLKEKRLKAIICEDKVFHVGDLEGLEVANKLIT